MVNFVCGASVADHVIVEASRTVANVRSQKPKLGLSYSLVYATTLSVSLKCRLLILFIAVCMVVYATLVR
jgi:hypothetical protein